MMLRHVIVACILLVMLGSIAYGEDTIECGKGKLSCAEQGLSDLNAATFSVSPIWNSTEIKVIMSNYGNATAKNIKYSLVDVNGTFSIRPIDPMPKDVLTSGERMEFRYFLVPKHLGTWYISPNLEWDDESGVHLSKYSGAKPLDIQVVQVTEPAPPPSFDIKFALIGAGVAIVAGAVGIYLMKRKPKEKVGLTS